MPPKGGSQRGGWYVVQQHDEITVVHATEAPSTKVKEGERLINVSGPFADETKAKERAESLRSRTLSVRAERVG